ncbi:MAG: hypothetical protein H6581_04350 [Bacteroidia bacterium]|nr:hypothetical protein [Bacteroidia bacterium]
MSENLLTLKSKAREAWVKFYQTRGVTAPNLAAVAASSGLSASDLHALYGKIEELEADVWLGWLETTLFRLQSSEEYPEYMARDKALAFFYTFMEVVGPNRTYIKTAFNQASFRRYHPYFLHSFRKGFDQYVQTLLKAGRENQEIMDRMLVDQAYPEIFWMQFIFVLNYWLNDKSDGASQTDAAIEKAVNLCFDLIGHTPLDSILDFSKFLFQKN